MNRFNKFENFAENQGCMARGKNVKATNLGAILFAALLIVCSATVGCSIDRPNRSNATNQISAPQPSAPSTVASSIPAALPEPAKPVVKKVVRKRPATVTYSDKTYGVSFDYPRKYAIETGDAAKEFVSSAPLPLNFSQPGGEALAAVELPETGFANTDFSSAFFNVSVHKDLTADQCEEFSVPQPVPVKATDDASKSESASANSPKLMAGDLELHGTEAVSGEGARQSDAKFFHVYQNNACYEFALNVTTMARNDGSAMKHIDRDKVFTRLEQILSTVKINAVVKPETVASEPAASEPAVAEKDKPASAEPTPAAATETSATTPTPEVTASAPATAPAQTEASPR